MNDHLEKQNDQEKNCLESVIRELSEVNCFGISKNNYEHLKYWIGSAVPNEKKSVFPDFVFDGGFIEHFVVTSSKETSRGAKQLKESMQFKKKNAEIFMKALENNKSNIPIKRFATRQFETHSHEYMVNSIKRNWEKHIKSYEKSDDIKDHSIFMLEYADSILQTAINDTNGKVYDSYRLSADKELLKWIYNFRSKIEYVILYNSASLEVIKTDQIIELIKVLPDAIYHPIWGFEADSYISF